MIMKVKTFNKIHNIINNMIIYRIVNITPLLEFLCGTSFRCSQVSNMRKVEKLYDEYSDDSIECVQDEIWDMVLNPWEYGLNAKGIMRCYALFGKLNRIKEKEKTYGTKANTY